MSKERLDQACEDHVARQFGQEVDFAIERSLPELLSDGLVTQQGVRAFPRCQHAQAGSVCSLLPAPAHRAPLQHARPCPVPPALPTLLAAPGQGVILRAAAPSALAKAVRVLRQGLLTAQPLARAHGLLKQKWGIAFQDQQQQRQLATATAQGGGSSSAAGAAQGHPGSADGYVHDHNGEVLDVDDARIKVWPSPWCLSYAAAAAARRAWLQLQAGVVDTGHGHHATAPVPRLVQPSTLPWAALQRLSEQARSSHKNMSPGGQSRSGRPSRHRGKPQKGLGGALSSLFSGKKRE